MATDKLDTFWRDIDDVRHDARLNGLIAIRLRDECDFDILKALNDPEHLEKLVRRMADTTGELVSLLCVIEDCDEPEEFASLFDGDAYEAGFAALLNAIVDFFPSDQRQRLRRSLIKGLEAAQQIKASTLKAIDQQIDQTDFHSVLMSSLTRGNGTSDCAESSEVTAGT